MIDTLVNFGNWRAEQHKIAAQRGRQRRGRKG
jgi:hypothetical protein